MGRLLKKKPVAQKKKKLSRALEEKTGQEASKKDNETANLSIVASKETKRQTTGNIRKAPSPIKAVVGGPAKNALIEKCLQFLREVKMELKKVTWPSRKQTIGSTVVVLVLVSIIALFLGVIDIGLSSLIQIVLQ